MIRLHEAILLGAPLLKPLGGVLLKTVDNQEYGCALGMAIKCNEGRPLKKRYQWAYEEIPTNLPCGCDLSVEISTAGVIAHLFDLHCADYIYSRCDNAIKPNPRKRAPFYTLEQIVDWVRSVDPTPEYATSEEKGDAIEVHRHQACASSAK